METVQENIENILKKNYLIPNYQRPYSWNEKQINELIDDLYENYNNDKEEFYFLGSIITINNNNHYEVIDGQQRITSLFLLLSNLFHITNNKILKNKILSLVTKNEKLKLILADYQNNEIFLRLIVNSSNDKAINKLYLENTLNKIQVRYIENFKLINKNLLNKKSSQSNFSIKKFADYLLNNIIIVHVNCSCLETGCRFFETMNNRGLNLRQIDLFKAFLINNNSEELKNNNELNKKLNDLFNFIDYRLSLDEKTEKILLNNIFYSFSKEGDLFKLRNEKEKEMYKILYKKLAKECKKLDKILEYIYNCVKYTDYINNKCYLDNSDESNNLYLLKLYSPSKINWITCIYAFKNNDKFSNNDYLILLNQLQKLYFTNDLSNKFNLDTYINKIIMNINLYDNFDINTIDLSMPSLSNCINYLNEFYYKKNNSKFNIIFKRFFINFEFYKNKTINNIFGPDEIIKKTLLSQIIEEKNELDKDKRLIYNYLIHIGTNKISKKNRLSDIIKNNKGSFNTTNDFITKMIDICDESIGIEINLIKNRKLELQNFIKEYALIINNDINLDTVNLERINDFNLEPVNFNNIINKINDNNDEYIDEE